MNCANHADVSAVAYCRTCGKPLCANCKRDVRGVIYCENCLAARLEGAQPPVQPFVQPPSTTVPPAGQGPAPAYFGGPNAALAGILAGFFPFGVGAVYTSQYAKGLAHLVVFTFLVWGQSEVNSGGLHTVLGLGLAFFYVYQIIDAVRSARALQMGLAPPDPFGMGQGFGGGDKTNAAKVPTGAVVLIGLGALFLLHTLGFADLGFERYWPVILIILGGWLFARRWGMLGPSGSACDCERCRMRCIFWPVMLVAVGVLMLLQSLTSRADLDRTWPVLLLVLGVLKLLQSNASDAGHISTLPPPASPPPDGPIPPPAPPSGEVGHV